MGLSRRTSVWIRLTLISFLLLSTTGFAWPALWPAPHSSVRLQDRTLARSLASFVASRHVSGRAFDDRLSAQLFDKFFEFIDKKRLFFVQEDIRHFENLRRRLDDQLRVRGELSFAVQVYRRYLDRLEERLEWAEQYLAGELSLEVPATVFLRGDAISFPTRNLARTRWIDSLKYRLIDLVQSGKSVEQARNTIRRQLVRKNEIAKRKSAQQVIEIYLNAAMKSYSPHTAYFSPQTLEDFMGSIRTRLEGIGAMLGIVDGRVIIRRVFAGGGASATGQIRSGDRLLAVSQNGKRFVETRFLELRQVIHQIRGRRGTRVILRIQKSDGRTLDVPVTRRSVAQPGARVRHELVRQRNPQTGNTLLIGVIDVPLYYSAQPGNPSRSISSTTNDARRALQQLRESNVDGVIVDLRGNGGGLLSEAVKFTGLFVGRGTVVMEAIPGRDPIPYRSLRNAEYDGPLAILIDRYSASASEITAGAVQDYQRGILIGDRSTFGKGTIQRVIPLSIPGASEPMGAIKLTEKGFFRPSGVSNQKVGIRSDIHLPSMIDHEIYSESSIDNALEFENVPAARFRTWNRVNAQVLAQLQRSHFQRMQTDLGLRRLRSLVGQYHRRIEREQLRFTEQSLSEDLRSFQRLRTALTEVGAGGKSLTVEFGQTPYAREVLRTFGEYVTLSAQEPAREAN